MPARLSEIDAVLRSLDGQIEESGGKHNYKARMPGKRVYPIPAHGGRKTPVPDEYINGLCRAFALDKAEFWRRLRGQ